MTRLFQRLQDAGFDTSPRVRLLVWEALHQEGSQYIGNIQELPWLLTPLLAKSARQQELLRQIFEDFLAECEEEAEQLSEQVAPPRPQDTSEESDKRKRWLWLLVPLVLLGIWLVIKAFPANDPLSLAITRNAEGPVRAGDTLRITNLSQGVPPADTAFVWEVVDDTTNAVLAAYHHVQTSDEAPQNESFYGNYLHQRWQVMEAPGRMVRLRLRHASYPNTLPADIGFTIQCTNPPGIIRLEIPDSATALRPGETYTLTAVTDRPARVVFTIKGEELAAILQDDASTYTHTLTHTFTEEGEVLVGLTAFDLVTPAYCSSRLKPIRLVVGSDKPILPLVGLQEDRPRLLLVVASWVRWLLLGFLLLAGWLFWRGRTANDTPAPEKTPEELEAEHPIHDAAPYFIPYRDRNQLIQVPADFYRMADVLRRRAKGERTRFDVQASVKATIQRGGFPQLLETRETLPGDYLVLAERPVDRHQQGRLWERLTGFWQQQDAPVTVWYHDGSFRSFWQQGRSDAWSLAQLQRCFPAHRLLILGNGNGLLNPYDTRRPSLLKEPAKILAQWPRRLLLTPCPPAVWSYREKLLHRHFLLYPADRRGLLKGLQELDALEEFEPAAYSRHESTRQHRRSTRHHLYRDWTDPETHFDYLADEPDTLRWLCGLAVSTAPDWSLTLAIGRALGVEVTHDRLLALTRIPWLADNEDHTALRLALLRRLTPEEEAAARQAELDELEAVHEQVTGSFAELEWKSRRAVQYFALDPRNTAHKSLIRDLKTAGLLSESQLQELDFVVQERLPRDSELPTEAYSGLDHYLQAAPRPPFWNRLRRRAALLALASLGLLLATEIYDRQADELEVTASPAFWQHTHSPNDEALKLHNTAVQQAQRMPTLAQQDFGAWRDFLQDTVPLIAANFREALSRRNGNYPLLDTNYAAFRYNWATLRLNLHLGIDTPAQWWVTAKDGRVTLLNGPGDVQGQVQAWQQTAAQYDDAVQMAVDARLPLLPDALHGRGLSHYYSFRLLPDSLDYCDSARFAYEQILDTDERYFTLLAATSPVHLESLLAQVSCERVNKLDSFTVLSVDPPQTPPSQGGAWGGSMVRIEGGTFTMGCQAGRDIDCYDKEKPAHQVTVSSFYLSKYEVTQLQWRSVMGSDPPELYNRGCDQCPVERVSWDDVQEFISKLNAQTGQQYRLPTEAEWEYASRGGNKSKGYLYSGGNNLNAVGWYAANYADGNTHGAEKTTRPVGLKKPNELGLYDMSGNVWEWCSDWYGAYGSGAVVDPKESESDSNRVVRGGGWSGNPRFCRAAHRYSYRPLVRYNYIGFRLAAP